MDTARIAELLAPFIPEENSGAPPFSPAVGERVGMKLLLEQLKVYLDLLLRWNSRFNLTAVREPEQVVTRHFGESLFAAHVLLSGAREQPATLADVGSGAGLPGIPIRLFEPQLSLTLIESNGRKAIFLREVLRALNLKNAEVFNGRAEEWNHTANLVTLRAVEKFAAALPVAARLVAPGGRLCLLIGRSQLDTARKLLPEHWLWREPAAIPLSEGRLVCIAGRG